MSQQQRINFSNKFHQTNSMLFFLSAFSSHAWTPLWWKLLRHLHSPRLMTIPCNKDRSPQNDAGSLWSSLPTLTTTAGPHLVMSHKSFITSSLALKIIKFPFLLCVPLLTDSRWGTLLLDKQMMRNRGMSLLTDMGASLNCLWSGLAFVFWTECRGSFFFNKSKQRTVLQDRTKEELSPNQNKDITIKTEWVVVTEDQSFHSSLQKTNLFNEKLMFQDPDTNFMKLTSGLCFISVN